MNLIIYLVICALGLCSGIVGQPEIVIRQIDQSADRFASNLFMQMIQRSDNKANFLIAPRNIFSFISIILAATGKTAEPLIRKALYVSPSVARETYPYKHLGNWPRNMEIKNEAMNLALTGQLFIDTDLHLKKEFLDLLKLVFAVDVTEVPFLKDSHQASSSINNWISKIMKENEDNFIRTTDINAMTKLLFASAATFSGQWLMRFQKSNEEKFQCFDPKVSQTVEMMEVESEFNFFNAPFLQSKLIWIPFQDKKTQMVIILPNAKDGLRNLETKLQAKIKANNPILTNFQPRMTMVRVRMPQWAIKSHNSFKGVLSDVMNLKDLFRESKVDYSPMTTPAKGLFVSDILQEASIKINDEGADVAVGTGAVIWNEGRPPAVEPFTVDHPFLFLVMDNKQTPLFMGRVLCL